MITAILKFNIRNNFSDWEQAFYSHQPTARAAGIFSLYHGHEPDDEQKVCVVMNILSQDHMQKFMEAHIKIDHDHPAPRIHFFDASDQACKKVFIGYIGPHLPTPSGH